MSEILRRVLLVEDDWMISIMLQDMIEELGFDVIGPIHTAREGLLQAGDIEVDFAVLDYDLGNGTDSLSIAKVLSARKIPFAFATGKGREEIGPGYDDVPLIYKPVLPEELQRILSA